MSASTLNSGMFSSATDNWATPQDFFDRLNEEFQFDIDVCADHENRKCVEYYTKVDDGLSRGWYGRCWMNPPYGREIIDWVRKARDSVQVDKTAELVVCLLPARTDTRWWHDYIWDTDNHCPRPGVEVRFIKGRLKFGDGKNSAPFPSAVVIFRPISQRK